MSEIASFTGNIHCLITACSLHAYSFILTDVCRCLHLYWLLLCWVAALLWAMTRKYLTNKQKGHFQKHAASLHLLACTAAAFRCVYVFVYVCICVCVPVSRTDWAPWPAPLSPAWTGTAGFRISSPGQTAASRRKPSGPSGVCSASPVTLRGAGTGPASACLQMVGTSD